MSFESHSSDWDIVPLTHIQHCFPQGTTLWSWRLATFPTRKRMSGLAVWTKKRCWIWASPLAPSCSAPPPCPSGSWWTSLVLAQFAWWAGNGRKMKQMCQVIFRKCYQSCWRVVFLCSALKNVFLYVNCLIWRFWIREYFINTCYDGNIRGERRIQP